MYRPAIAGVAFLSASVLAAQDRATEVAQPRETGTYKLAASPESTFRPETASITKFDDGSVRLDVEVTGSTSGPRTIAFDIDPDKLTYTATLRPTSESDLALLEAGRPPTSQKATPKPRETPEAPLVPPGGECCMDTCEGGHQAIMHTDDPLFIDLVTSILTSSWEVYESNTLCKWQSYGLLSCYPETPIPTIWYLLNKQSSFPNGGYKYVNHWGNCNFQNYNWHNPNLPTGTTHDLRIKRTPGVIPTTVQFSFAASGEDFLLLKPVLSDAGYNSCH
jgi:hypothetical protein